MKKFINVLAVLLALVMCLGVVVACATDDEGATDGTTTAATTTKAPDNTTTATQNTTTAEDTTTVEDQPGIETPEVDVPADGMITSAAQLHAVLVNGAADGTYTVNAEKLDMGKYKWNGMVNFAGTFDFGGCTIENAKYSLFVSVTNGTIKNLKIANSTYVYTDEDAKADLSSVDNTTQGNIYYSPVVRYAKNITIQNVTIESTVSIKSDIYTDGSSHAGVFAYATGNTIIIENCHFKGNIATDSLLVRVGGVVGVIDCSDKANLNKENPEESLARVMNCTNSGKVENVGSTGDSKAGGVIAYMSNAAAVNCANYGEMLSNDKGQTGGVVGYVGNDTYMKNCLNTGKVVGVEFIGGICAYSNGSERYFMNCINLGNVSCSNDSNNNWGGVIGLARSSEKLTNCFNLHTEAGTLKMVQVQIDKQVVGALNPADTATYGNLVIVNCGDLDSVDAIYTAIENAAPGVFEKADGSLRLVIAE